MTPLGMPKTKPQRLVQGRYAALSCKWSDGKWKDETDKR